MPNLDVAAYLARIGYRGDEKPTADALRALQFAHLSAVPYENLDLLQGIPLSLEVEKLYDKIVCRHRGGYCFELNELFGWLLRTLGYEVTDYFARFLSDEPSIPMRRHHVLGVSVPGEMERWLCDVGVGSGSPNFPVKMVYALEQSQGNECYRFDLDAFLGWVLKTRKQGVWKPLFSFTEEPQLPIDFVATSFYCEHAPDSPFHQAAMISRRTSTGRYTLDGDTFKHFDGEQVTVWKEKTAQARTETIMRLFGLAEYK
ncbi:MAG: arylamine N-acetyltransferase [Clostridia bacterium]